MARKFLARVVIAAAAATAASLLPVAAASAAPNASAAAPRTASVHPAAKSANARPDGGTITAGTSIGTAWPPLQGGTVYSQTNAFAGFPEDWYILYKKPDSRIATIRIVNTTVNGTGCPYINANLYDNHGTADGPLSSVTLNANSSSTFAVPAKLASDPHGLYYLVLQGDSSACNSSGGAAYSIEPEPGAEWSTASRALPGGPSRRLAGGPLAGGVNYAATLPGAGSQDWAFFVTRGATTVHVQDTSAGSAGCKLVVTAGPSTAALTAGQVAGLHVTKAGRYALELAVAGGCKPKSPVSALLKLTGAIKGPVLAVTDPTLKTGAVKKAYSATIVVTGGKKPYAFTAITALPPGLKLTRSTGVISGRPTKAGSYTVMVTITDSGRPARNTVTIPIKITIT